nr:hypothetical protein [Marseillevirus cajuinensis]
MDFFRLPREIQEHIFGFCPDFGYAFCCRDFYDIFSYNKEKYGKMPLNDLILQKSAFACLPKFSDISGLHVELCERANFLLPLEVHLRRLEKGTHAKFVLFCQYIGLLLPQAWDIVPKSGKGAFSYGVGVIVAQKAERPEKFLAPEMVCGLVVSSCFSRKFEGKTLSLSILISEEMEEMNEKEVDETKVKLSAVLGVLLKDAEHSKIAPLRDVYVEASQGKFPEGTEDLMLLLK